MTIIKSADRIRYEAFKTIYVKLYSRVFKFARRFVNPDEAADITTDAFVELWKLNKIFYKPESAEMFLMVNVRDLCPTC